MTREALTELGKAQNRRAPQGATGVLLCTLVGSGGLVTLLVTTAARSDARLGAPAYWAWVLTGLQVAALWAVGGGQRWGWPLGAAVQPAWIAYALVTGQVGFIPGCIVSGAVQIANVLRQARNRQRREDAAEEDAAEVHAAKIHAAEIHAAKIHAAKIHAAEDAAADPDAPATSRAGTGGHPSTVGAARH